MQWWHFDLKFSRILEEDCSEKLLVFAAAFCCSVSPLQAQFQAGYLLPIAGMLVGPELLPVLSVRNVD